MDTNASGASKAGASDEKILAVVRFRESDLFTSQEKLAFELAEAMTETPQHVTDDLVQRLRKYYSEAEMVEMAAVIALENFRSRFNRCFEVEPHGFYSRSRELLAAAGFPG